LTDDYAGGAHAHLNSEDDEEQGLDLRSRSVKSRSSGMYGRRRSTGRGRSTFSAGFKGYGITAGAKYSSRSRAPVAYGTSVRATPPGAATYRGGFKVTNRELLTTLIWDQNGSDFQNYSYSVQPGTLVPWLANIARNYTRWVGTFRFEYVSAQSSVASGSVVMGFNRNANEPPYGSLQQFMASQNANIFNVWMNGCVPADCRGTTPSEKMLFIRSGSLEDGQDILLYDAMTFQVALSAIAGFVGDNMGQIWCEYTVNLFDQKVEGSGSQGENIFSATELADGAPVTTPIVDSSLNLFNFEYGNGDCQYAIVGGGTSGYLTFNSPGYYKVTWYQQFEKQSGSTTQFGGVTSTMIGMSSFGADLIVGTPTDADNGVTGFIVQAPTTSAIISQPSVAVIVWAQTGNSYISAGQVVGSAWMEFPIQQTAGQIQSGIVGTGSAIFVGVASWVEVLPLTSSMASFYNVAVFPSQPAPLSVQTIVAKNRHRSVKAVGIGPRCKRARVITHAPREVDPGFDACASTLSHLISKEC